MDRAIDPDVQRGQARQLTGQAIALEDCQARVLGLDPRDEGDFVLGDGTTGRLRLAFTYSRGLGLGQTIVPDEVLAGHAAAPSRVLLLPSLALVVLAVVGLAVMVPAGLALGRPASEGAGVRD